jgi:hypothetical protein
LYWTPTGLQQQSWQVGLTISASLSIYLSKKNRTATATIPSAGSRLLNFFCSRLSTASALQRTELHTGTFIACANCDQCRIPDLDYGSALLGSPSGSRALAQHPHNTLARLPLALIALPLFRSSSLLRTATVYRPADPSCNGKSCSSTTKGKKASFPLSRPT